MAKQSTKWVCSECGNIQARWSGSCDSCTRWNTFEETLEIKESKKRFTSKQEFAKPILIKDVNLEGFNRIKTFMGYHLKNKIG